MKCRIGIRPTIDGRWGGIREGLEEQTMAYLLKYRYGDDLVKKLADAVK